MKQNKCYVCGRTGSNFYLLETSPDVPEIKKGTYVCSQRCFNSLVGTIKRNRVKANNKSIRKHLETSEDVPSEDDLYAILTTLTEKERKVLCAIGIGVLFAEVKNCKQFYQLLKQKVD